MDGDVYLKRIVTCNGILFDDFHLFGPTNESLRGKRFESNEYVKALQCKSGSDVIVKNNNLADAIKKLLHCWVRCINVAGDFSAK